MCALIWLILMLSCLLQPRFFHHLPILSHIVLILRWFHWFMKLLVWKVDVLVLLRHPLLIGFDCLIFVVGLCLLLCSSILVLWTEVWIHRAVELFIHRGMIHCLLCFGGRVFEHVFALHQTWDGLILLVWYHLSCLICSATWFLRSLMVSKDSLTWSQTLRSNMMLHPNTFGSTIWLIAISCCSSIHRSYVILGKLRFHVKAILVKVIKVLMMLLGLVINLSTLSILTAFSLHMSGTSSFLVLHLAMTINLLILDCVLLRCFFSRIMILEVCDVV